MRVKQSMMAVAMTVVLFTLSAWAQITLKVKLVEELQLMTLSRLNSEASMAYQHSESARLTVKYFEQNKPGSLALANALRNLARSLQITSDYMSRISLVANSKMKTNPDYIPEFMKGYYNALRDDAREGDCLRAWKTALRIIDRPKNKK